MCDREVCLKFLKNTQNIFEPGINNKHGHMGEIFIIRSESELFPSTLKRRCY